VKAVRGVRAVRGVKTVRGRDLVDLCDNIDQDLQLDLNERTFESEILTYTISPPV
jgi:hypothetical protein